MPASHHPLYSSIVRIRDATGAIVGAGFLAAPGLVCTCAHVVADALDIPRETEQPPEREVRLDFPFLDEAEVNARIQVWVRMEPNDGGGDIAVLRLMTDSPVSALPMRLLPVSNLSGRHFEAYGFPSTTDVGQYTYGILRDRLSNGYIQLEGTATQGYRVQQGYSGTPVWDTRGRGVVGMVVAADRTPEAKVAFLIPNDLIQHACPTIKPITLHQMFALMTDGLTGLPGSPLSGVEQFLCTYLGTPNAPAPFGGRQIQLAQLDRWLATPRQPYALLVADAGRGKSALLTQWVAAVADEGRAEVAFVPISIRFGTSLKSTSVNLLGARLRHLHGVKADPPRDANGWLAEIDLYLREDRFAGPPLLIILDGADEAADWMMGRDLRFPPEPGRGIKVLVSARSMADCDAEGWVRRLEWQEVAVPMELPLLDRAGVAEVLQSMGDPLARLVTQVDVVGKLHLLSEGEPLLVRLYVEALLGTGERAAFLTPEDLQHLEPGLEAYFDQWWDDQRRQWGTSAPLKEPAVRAVLNLLACALGPLSSDDLLALMEPERIDLWLLEEALRPLARFVVGDGKEKGYVFSHPRLNQYFYEKLPPSERQAWEHHFMSFGKQTLAALTCGERDPRKVSFYLVRYYGAHLERGGADPDLFDELVNESWLRAWEALEGTYDGFLSDLTRAWKRAEASGAYAQSTLERGRAIGRICRYALIAASIKGMAGNIPPDLVGELIMWGIWTPIQGLAYARQIPLERQRASALKSLAAHLTVPLLQEALAAARTLDDADNTYVLADLLPRLGELGYGEQALEVARTIAYEASRAEVLADLAPHLPASLQVTVLQEALEAARTIANGYRRVEALKSLAPHLPEPLLQEALEAARTIADEERRVNALVSLAAHLPESLQVTVLLEALAAARMIADEASRAEVLKSLALHLPEPLLLEALEAARMIADEASRAEVLADLVPHLPASLQVTVLQEALAAVRTIADEKSRAEMLANLLPCLGELGYGEEALETARTIAHEESRVKALKSLAPHLPEPLLLEALETARAVESPSSRVEALVGLSAHLPASLQVTVLQEALAVARALEYESNRAWVLTDLVPHLPTSLQVTVLQEALAAVRASTRYGNEAAAILFLLASRLPPSLQVTMLQEALIASRTLADEESRARVLLNLLLRLGELGHGEQALETARAFENEYFRAEVLLNLLPRLGELGYGEQALEAARTIAHEYSRAEALVGLVPHLPASLQVTVLQEALATARTIAIEYSRARVLKSLAPHLPEPLLQEALEAARTIAHEYSRAEALVGLVPHLPPSLQVTVLQEALAAARAIEHEEIRALALLDLAPHLPEPLLREALAVAQALENEKGRAWVVANLLLHLGELGYGEEALAAARTITYENRRVEALVGLVPHLPPSLQVTVLQEALAAARAIEHEEIRVEALVNLVPHLPTTLQVTVLQEALAVARAIADQFSRDRALETLTPHLPAPLLQEALAAARALEIEKGRAWEVVSVLSRLGELGYAEEALAAARALEDERDRAEVLVGLIPYLPVRLLQDVLEIARALENNESKARVLASLVPHLPMALRVTVLQEALAAARGIWGEESRARVLMSLVPDMKQLAAVRLYSLWCETIRTPATRWKLLSDIQSLAPIITVLGGKEALVATGQAIIEVGKWFP